MASRPLMIATLVGASVGVPYLASHSSLGRGGNGGGQPPANNSPYQASTPYRLPSTGQTPQVQPPPSSAIAYPSTIRPTQFTSVDQVFRFDVTKDWVYRNWDRKSTGPTDVGLFGVRVPLVMAPRIDALAGSLTYYFNSQGQVEHISFHGRTGDSTLLVQLLTTTYKFERVDSPAGEQVYQVRYRGQPQSELRTHPEAVLWSSSPNQSIAVDLEFARPGSERVLPARPTGFEALQVAAAPAAESASTPEGKSGSSAAETKSGSYFDKIRHATPQEESQVLWKRWPN
jgi:hypothetical protein